MAIDDEVDSTQPSPPAATAEQPGTQESTEPATPRYDLMGDETLVTLSEKGDQGAFDVLIHRHLDHIFTTLLAALGSTLDATSALATCLGRISTSLSDFRGDTSYVTWQERIIRDEMSVRLKARYRSRSMVVTPWFEALDLDRSMPLHAATKTWFERAVTALPENPPLAKALDLSLTRRERPEQVAAHCGVAQTQLPVLIFEALHQLAHSRKAVDIDESDMDDPETYATRIRDLADELPLDKDIEAREEVERRPGDLPSAVTLEEAEAEERYQATTRILAGLPTLEDIDDENLRKRISNIFEFVTALTAEDISSEVGRVVDEEDVPLARCAQAAWFAGCDDFAGRLDPEIAARLVGQSWEVLLGTLEAAKPPTGLRGWISSNPILATLVASAAVLAGSFIYYYAYTIKPPPPPPLPKADSVTARPSEFGRIPSPPGNADDTLAYHWAGSSTPRSPKSAQVRLIAQSKGGVAVTEREADAIAERFEMADGRLDAPELSDAYIYGKGSAQSPEPGSYRLDIRSTDGRWALAWIGTGEEAPPAAGSEAPTPAEAISKAREYLTGKGVEKASLSEADVEPLGDGQVAVRFHTKVDGLPVMDETGTSKADEAAVVFDADGTVIEAEGWSPATVKTSTYALMPPQTAISGIQVPAGSAGDGPAATQATVNVSLDKLTLVYQYLQSEQGKTYLVPVYVFTGENGSVAVVVEAVKQKPAASP